MSDIIRLLPDTVANQIAAGEVIQRPSSVIKELVENSLDAGASDIKIIVVDAGKTNIQVIDNGKGMSETDARLAFERHATSKITQATDLFALQTMGFRGEALASIAAVSQVELRTRQQGVELGVSLTITGGNVQSQEPISCPIGANFSVRNLFFNIPARRKFLKSHSTELSHILSEIERVALSHPDVAFTLYSDEQCLLQLSPGNFKQRIVGLFGKKIDHGLLPVKVDTSVVAIHGYVGTPTTAKKKGSQRFFFVNGRYMRHPYFDKAVQSAYDRLMTDGAIPSYFLHFTIDPAHIDVNIHPQKTEIKFQDEQAIWPIILAGVREALGKSAAMPSIDFDTANCPVIPAFAAMNTEVTPPEIEIDRNYNPFETSHGVSSDAKRNRDKFTTHMSSTQWTKAYEQALSSISPTVEPPPSSLFASSSDNTNNFTQSISYAVKSIEPEQCLQVIGRYIVVSTSIGMQLVDQHRAHLRVLYEKFMSQLSQHVGTSQGMLFPELLQLSPAENTMMAHYEPHLLHIGFELSPLGGGAYSILGIPSGTEGLDPVDLLQTIIAEAVEGEIKLEEQVHKHIANRLANKAALPIGQYLSKQEQAELVMQLFRCVNPSYTPDGELVFKTIDAQLLQQYLH